MRPKGESRRYEAYMSLFALNSLSFGRCASEVCQHLSYLGNVGAADFRQWCNLARQQQVSIKLSSVLNARLKTVVTSYSDRAYQL
jgi:hypothetical protein